MRILTPTVELLAVAGLLLGASVASATSIDYSVRGGALGSYSVSDNVVVDVFLNADPDIQTLSISVVADAGVFSYDAAASAALPVIYAAPPAIYGTTGAAPGYILYQAGAMTVPTTVLYPLQNPFVTWPAPPPGKVQVNINYAEPAFNGTAASGSGIWIASLVFHVDADFDSSDIVLSISNGGNIMTNGSAQDISGSLILPMDPITVSGHLVPEPTTALLIGLGLVGLTVAGRRKA